ncbi:RING-type E3 ubiquitin-protein ligase PPIL2-like [Oscarella lobularis]|uniref:RING-type E3 ubiquitin-protein ligase PPIL2-like n=1 Tax=Oscarella lobularis TaxID=121494 RepID=UPI003313F411
MGKKQHQKDKMYITMTEWTHLYGGKKPGPDVGQKSKFRRLPFYCCSLSLQPFEHPYCTKDGRIFDLLNIVPYLKQYGHNPVTGEPLEAKSLIKLAFHKNAEGKFHCPVTYRVFTESTHIVAVRTTGNVFSYDAVERLNLKAKNFRELLTDEPFTKADIIHLQDPNNLDKFNLADFYHLKNNLKVADAEEEKAKLDPMYHLKQPNAETKMALEELYKDYKPPEKEDTSQVVKAPGKKAAHYSTGAVAHGFTSTAMSVVTKHEAAVIDVDTLRYDVVARRKKKGYIRLTMNLGDLNLELHCDQVPRTCDNFLRLCKSGYYKGTIFHRSIKNFMIQGGDPKGTGKGGESAFGKPFKDEFRPHLTHTGRGILSMANSGPDTNKSQFFITFRSCKHLDNKHTVFGRVVGGMDTLVAMERVETNDKDRPKTEIKIDDVQVFVNPFEEVEKEFSEEPADTEEPSGGIKETEKPEASAASGTQLKKYHSGVGKYIKPKPMSTTSASSTAADKKTLATDQPSSSKRPASPSSASGRAKVKKAGGFRDFSAW